jgi:hypothetical protein
VHELGSKTAKFRVSFRVGAMSAVNPATAAGEGRLSGRQVRCLSAASLASYYVGLK